MIRKMLQEVEDSTNDKERRAEIGWHTTSSSRDKRATKPDNVRVLRIRLGWTLRNMGNFCEDKAKILVEKYV